MATKRPVTKNSETGQADNTEESADSLIKLQSTVVIYDDDDDNSYSATTPI